MLALVIDDAGIGVFGINAIGDGVEQVGLTHTGRAVNEQGVIHHTGIVHHCLGGIVCQLVGGTHHKVLEGEFGIDIHNHPGILVLIFLQLLLVQHLELGFGFKHLLQRFLNVGSAAVGDHIPAELIGAENDQVIFVKFQHLGIVKPGGYRGFGELLLQIAYNFRPNIG